MCREEGAAISDLAATDEAKGFGFFGIIKEIGVDDKGLETFSSKYYPDKPLYLDSDMDFYRALGDRKLGLSVLLNPFKLYSSMKDIKRRHSEKKIDQNLKGEGLKQGGVIVFDSAGIPKYSYLEKTGEEIPTDDLLAALKDVSAKGKAASEL